MIIKLDIKFDIQKLKDYLKEVESKFIPNLKENGPWGGWSVTSSNGSYLDGWQTGEKIHNQNIANSEKNELIKLFNESRFDQPTEIHFGYVLEVIDGIKKLNLKPSRIRIALLKPHPEDSAYWHLDGEPSKERPNLFRLHIPIRTNDKCFFEYENSRHHLEADGSCFIINVSKKHRALNLSSENRYHLIMDIEKV